MRAKIVCLYLFSFLILVPLLAQPTVELAQKINLLKAKIEARQGMVFHIIHDFFSGDGMTRTLELDDDRNYRIFLVNQNEIQELKAECILAPNLSSKRRVNPPDGGEYEGIDCYHWFIMTFSSNMKIEIRINRAVPQNRKIEYAILVASAGRSIWPDVRRMSDSRGNIYELQDDHTIYRNGRKHITIKNYVVTSICVSSLGGVYSKTVEGYVMHDSSTFVKSSRRQAVRMVAGKNNALFILFNDGTIYNRMGSLTYRRNREKEAIDLIEDNGMVWAITREGKRIELCNDSVMIQTEP